MEIRNIALIILGGFLVVFLIYRCVSNNRDEMEDQSGYDKIVINESQAIVEDSTEDTVLSQEDIERCLLQQTTSYERDDPFITATNKENELFVIHFYDNTFYIVKVIYENDQLNVEHDYRRQNALLERFQYRIKRNNATAVLKLSNEDVEFIVQPKMDYQGSGYCVEVDQTDLYKEFVSYLDTYRDNINSSAAERKKETGYRELLQSAGEISDADKEEIWDLLDRDEKVMAIKLIQESTGLGLADCKKIADNPSMYL